MRRLRFLLPILSIGLILGLAACGDDDKDGGDKGADKTTETTSTSAVEGGLTDEEFRQKVEPICAEYAEEAEAANKALDDAEDGQDVAKELTRISDASAQARDEIAEVGGPADEVDDFDALLEAFNDLARLTKELAEAASDEDRAEYEKVNKELQAVDVGAANRLGVPGCGE